MLAIHTHYIPSNLINLESRENSFLIHPMQQFRVSLEAASVIGHR